MGYNAAPLERLIEQFACGRCIGRSHVDMPLGNDNALADLHLACRTDKLATGRPDHITGFTHRCDNTNGARIGHAQLHLRGAAARAENRNIGKLLLRADNRHALVRRVLAGLRKLFFHSELISFAEQGLQIGLGYMHMTGRSFHKNIHYKSSFQVQYYFSNPHLKPQGVCAIIKRIKQ